MAKQSKQRKPFVETSLDSTSTNIISYSPFLVLGCILALVFITYGFIWQNGLVWDDDPYITLNESVKNLNVKDLISGFHVGNYHPLTMLSLSMEYLLVGEKPWLYHFNNLVLHSLNCFVLYNIFNYLKFSQTFILIFIALFAVHPMHVESVAWAAERKDVLYTFFLLLSFYYYIKFSKENSTKYYLISILLFVASCLSKGMAVVLPALLLITDWWILKKPLNWKNSIEKIPFFGITLIFAYLATTAQKEAGADATSVIKAAFSGGERFKIVSYSYLFYWIKTLVPINLLPFYPYPTKVGGNVPGLFNLAVLGVVLFGVVSYWFGRRNKMIWWAVCFFTISISTVIQILPVGSAIVADRYYYLSSIGPLFLFAWFFSDKIEKGFKIFKSIAFVFIAVYGLMAFFQTRHWKNGYTLFKPAEKFYPEDAMVLSNIGWYHLGQKEFPTAKSYLMRSDNNGFKNADVCRTIGSMFIDEGDYKTALTYLERAQLFLPKNPRTDWLTALAHQKLNNYGSALPFSEIAIKSQPENFEYLNTHSQILMGLKRFNESNKIIEKLIQLKPENLDSYLNVAYTKRLQGDLAGEVKLLEDLIGKNPSYLPAYRNIGVTLSDLGRHYEAVEYWKKAISFDKTGDYEYNIGINFAMRGQLDTAKEWHIKAAKKGKLEAQQILKTNGVIY